MEGSKAGRGHYRVVIEAHIAFFMSAASVQAYKILKIVIQIKKKFLAFLKFVYSVHASGLDTT